MARLAKDYRAVVAGLSGRVAPPAAYTGARTGRVPFVLWASLWAHPRTLPHAASYLVVRHLYRHADAIATYGPHVSAYVRAQGATNPVVEAPQSVDNEFWIRQSSPIRRAAFQARLLAESLGKKASSAHSGLEFLGSVGTQRRAGSGRRRSDPSPGRRHRRGPVRRAPPPAEVRNFYAGSDVVVVPSVATRDFREPWGLVVNEAFNQGVPVIATDAVGAVAGGLVRHERTGLVVPAGDPAALAAALRRMHDEPALRARLGAAAREAVKAYTHDAWAAGMSKALQSVGASRAPRSTRRTLRPAMQRQPAPRRAGMRPRTLRASPGCARPERPG